MPAPGPLSADKIAVLEDPAFRARFVEERYKSYFPAIDNCLRSIGPECRRLPWLYNILVGEATKTKDGWEWFKKQYPKINLESPKPSGPKPKVKDRSKDHEPKGVAKVVGQRKRNLALEKTQADQRNQRREDMTETGPRGPAVQRAVKMLKSYGGRKK